MLHFQIVISTFLGLQSIVSASDVFNAIGHFIVQPLECTGVII